MVGLAIGLIIALAGIIALLFIYDREKRRRISAERKAEKVAAEGTAQGYREEAKKLRKQTEQLRVKQSPISSSPETSTALGERLDLANARADYLDALLDAQEEIIRARERAEILEAENRLKELKSKGASAEEIQEAENQLNQLREATK